MKKLQKNNRNKIIDAATKLFYENGYNNTSFEKIAEFCEITKPLITYHFKTKANLAKEVVLKCNIEMKNQLDEKIFNTFENYDLYYSTVAELIVLIELYSDDEKATRFFLEYLNSGFENLFINNLTSFYKIIDRRYHLNINRDSNEITMLSTAAMFASLSLLYSYLTGKLECSYDDFKNYSVRLQLKIMNINNEEIDEIVEGGKRILNDLEYKICPYFKVL